MTDWPRVTYYDPYYGTSIGAAYLAKHTDHGRKCPLLSDYIRRTRLSNVGLKKGQLSCVRQESFCLKAGLNNIPGILLQDLTRALWLPILASHYLRKLNPQTEDK